MGLKGKKALNWAYQKFTIQYLWGIHPPLQSVPAYRSIPVLTQEAPRTIPSWLYNDLLRVTLHWKCRKENSMRIRWCKLKKPKREEKEPQREKLHEKLSSSKSKNAFFFSFLFLPPQVTWNREICCKRNPKRVRLLVSVKYLESPIVGGISPDFWNWVQPPRVCLTHAQYLGIGL